jgi:nucleotide-binding universal stress UspA family protein
MFKRILVPLDGSPLADRALPYAEALARRTGGQILLIRAIDTWALLDGGRHGRKAMQLEDEAERQLSNAAGRLKAGGVQAAFAVELGEAAMIIARAQQSNSSDLVVMSTHGRGGLGRLAYGSVAERVLRHSPCPVLLVPPEAEESWRSSADATIVVPLDGSTLAEEALAPARELASLFGAGLTLLEVIEPPPPGAYEGAVLGAACQYLDPEQWAQEASAYTEGIVGKLAAEGYSAASKCLVGYAAATIDQQVRETGALAVVMASHGRTGLPRMVLGSVAQGIVQRTTVPVLVTRPAVMREHLETRPNIESTALEASPEAHSS